MSLCFTMGLAVDRIAVSVFTRIRPRRPRNRGLIPVRATDFPALLIVEICRRARRVSYETRDGYFPCVVSPELEAKHLDFSRF